MNKPIAVAVAVALLTASSATEAVAHKHSSNTSRTYFVDSSGSGIERSFGVSSSSSWNFIARFKCDSSKYNWIHVNVGRFTMPSDPTYLVLHSTDNSNVADTLRVEKGDYEIDVSSNCTWSVSVSANASASEIN